MELKVVKAPGQDPFNAVKMAVIMSLIGNGKIYELLHKQIWRKAQYRIRMYDQPLYRTHNGRPVKFISSWNIKSYAIVPYSYSGGDHTFGLNQLFVGQSPYEVYEGDPGDGIYHDDCYITTKMLQLESGEINAWAIGPKYGWADGDASLYPHIYRDKDKLGNTLITNVEYVRYTVVVNNITNYKHKVILTTPTGSRTIELGSAPSTYNPLGEWELKGLTAARTYSGVTESWQKDHATVMAELVAQHGPVVWSQTITNNSPWGAILNNPELSRDGKILIFRNGVVLEYVPWNRDNYGDDYADIPAHYKVLVMVYTDTGDLVMSRAEFIEKWEEYFELVVHEDSEWWESLLAPIIAIVTIVIAAYTGIYLGGWETFAGAATFISGGVTAFGILSGSKELMLAGAIIGLTAVVSGIAQAGAQAAAQAGAPTGASIGTAAANELLVGASAGQLFDYFVSGAGLGNLLSVGSNVLKVFSGVQGLGADGEQQTMPEVMDEAGKTVLAADEEEEGLDAVMALCNI